MREFNYAAACNRAEWIAKTKAFLTARSSQWRDAQQTESVSDLLSRATEVMDIIYAEPNQPVLIVTHELFIQAILTLGDRKTANIDEMSKHFFSRLRDEKIPDLKIIEWTTSP